MLSFLVQVSSVPQQQTAEFDVAEDGRDMKWCIAGDVCTASLSSTSQQQLRHSVVRTSYGVVQRRSAFVVLEVDVGVQLKQRVHGDVQTSTDGNEQG